MNRRNFLASVVSSIAVFMPSLLFGARKTDINTLPLGFTHQVQKLKANGHKSGPLWFVEYVYGCNQNEWPALQVSLKAMDWVEGKPIPQNMGFDSITGVIENGLRVKRIPLHSA